MDYGSTTRPLLTNLIRGLVSLLSVLLVPLLYVEIFRARKKHARVIGELDNIVICLLMHTRDIRERENEEDKE